MHVICVDIYNGDCTHLLTAYIASNVPMMHIHCTTYDDGVHWMYSVTMKAALCTNVCITQLSSRGRPIVGVGAGVAVSYHNHGKCCQSTPVLQAISSTCCAANANIYSEIRFELLKSKAAEFH